MGKYTPRSPSPRDPSLDGRSAHDNDDIYEKGELLGPGSTARNPARWVSNYWFNALFLANVAVALFLLFAFVVLVRQPKSCLQGPRPPYSLLREDSAVQYINTQYKPQKIYQSPSSPEVDRAWDGWLEEYDRLVMIPKDEAAAAGFPESVEPLLDPGYAVYGLAVYHQMHCLNRIRKSFNANRFFPDDSPESVEYQKNHCFDVLCQSLLCHGDIAMVYWWNRNFTYIDDNGAKHYSDWYLQSSPEQRSKGTFTAWDTQVQCRDMEAIHAWMKAHQLDIEKYRAQSVD